MCPEGTFGSLTGQVATGGCTPCTRGSFCAEPGLTSPTGKCDAGYICLIGSTTPRPDATLSPPVGTAAMGSICPKGGYCEIGSYKIIEC